MAQRTEPIGQLQLHGPGKQVVACGVRRAVCRCVNLAASAALHRTGCTDAAVGRLPAIGKGCGAPACPSSSVDPWNAIRVLPSAAAPCARLAVQQLRVPKILGAHWGGAQCNRLGARHWPWPAGPAVAPGGPQLPCVQDNGCKCLLAGATSDSSRAGRWQRRCRRGPSLCLQRHRPRLRQPSAPCSRQLRREPRRPRQAPSCAVMKVHPPVRHPTFPDTSWHTSWCTGVPTHKPAALQLNLSLPGLSSV